MRHHNAARKFNRSQHARTALMRNLVLSLVKHNRIETTEAKAKELRPYVEKLVSRGMKDTLANRRILLSRLYNNNSAVEKIIKEIAPKYKDRTGGYTRVLKLLPRLSDGARMAVIEFV